MALESRKYHHSTQNRELYRTVSLDFFRKKSTFPLCFHFTIIFQVTPGAQSIPKIFGIKLQPKFLLCLQTVFCFLIVPVAIGQSNQGYVIAVVLLFFLRQIYVIYSSAKLLKIVQINEK